ncbi:signal peptidase I [Halobacteriales archaeon QS_3_64_16]|nr:MAG: signal peptidase I [Halobacteriales archaeon QS_3_64_16]
MEARSALANLLTGALVAVVGLLVLGAVLGQPVLLSYVETGSMQPTLEPGEGFVAIPAAVAGPIEEGDVITYRAEEVQGGGLTTHRVVGETDEGYVTRGDANPFTDQDGDEPPVKDAQIVAKVLQVGGEVVVIPGLGIVVTGTQDVLRTVQATLASLLGTSALLGVQGLAYLIFAFTIVVYVVDALRNRGRRRRDRGHSRDTGTDVRLIVGAFAALLVVAATASMVAPAGTHEFGVVSAEFDSERPDIIPAGESKSRTYIVPNSGLIPVQVFLEPASEGIDVRPRETAVGSRDQVNATVTLSAPPETGYYRRFLVEYRYLAVLPVPVIQALYGVHPWTPIVVIDALLGGGFYLLGITLVGTGRVRSRTRPQRRSWSARLRRMLR